jgi:hypothetical protein
VPRYFVVLKSWTFKSKCITYTYVLRTLQVLKYWQCRHAYIKLIRWQYCAYGTSSIFWDIMTWSPLKVFWRFGETCSFQLRPWRWRRRVPRKDRFTFNVPHGLISQKIKLFSVRSSKPTFSMYITLTFSVIALRVFMKHKIWLLVLTLWSKGSEYTTLF